MSSDARVATNAGSMPRSRIASAVTGPIAATRTRGDSPTWRLSPSAATVLTLVRISQS